MATKKRAPRKSTTKKPAADTVNKAQAIRDAADELGKKARPRDIIAALAAKGITVSPPQVSMTLKAAGLRNGKRKKKPASGRAPKASRNGKSIELNIDDVIEVKELAARLGGLDKLKDTIAVLEELQRIWYAV